LISHVKNIPIQELAMITSQSAKTFFSF